MSTILSIISLIVQLYSHAFITFAAPASIDTQPRLLVRESHILLKLGHVHNVVTVKKIIYNIGKLKYGILESEADSIIS